MGLAKDRKIPIENHPLEKPVNWDLVDLYLKSGCKQENIAACFHITPETLSYKVEQKYGVPYSVYSRRLYHQGDNLLLGAQFQKALQGNITMLQFLGKCRLNQKEGADEQLPKNQDDINKDHQIMFLEAELQRLKEERKLNADESQTE